MSRRALVFLSGAILIAGCVSSGARDRGAIPVEPDSIELIAGPSSSEPPERFYQSDRRLETVKTRARVGRVSEFDAILAKRAEATQAGANVTIGLDSARLDRVASAIGELSGLNIHLDPETALRESAELYLENSDWISILKALAVANDLALTINGERHFPEGRVELAESDIIFLSAHEYLEKRQDRIEKSLERSARIDLARRAQSAGQPEVFSYHFNYADPVEAVEYLRKLYASKPTSSEPVGAAVTDRAPFQGAGKATFALYAPKNMVTVSAPPSIVDEILRRLEEIDVQPKQIYIDARIVEIERSHIRDLGIEWGGALTRSLDNALPNYVRVDGGADGADFISLPGAHTLGVESARGASIGIAAGSITDSIFLRARLTALERAGRAKAISNPKIIATNGSRAQIKSGREVPYQASSANLGASVQFKEAALALVVTPIALADDKIRMNILASKNEVDTILKINDVPAIKKKEILTSVVVNDGGSAALGGIYEDLDSDSSDSVPLISKIPLLGWLFRSNRKEGRELELLVFITPTILKER